MEMKEHLDLPIAEASQIGDARRRATEVARDLGWSETEVGRVGIVVTEAATNLVRHGGGGDLLLGTLRRGSARGVEIVALDRGPGIANVRASLRDGVSTAGTPGTGLGAIARLASLFDVYSAPGTGVVLLARLWPKPEPPPETGIVTAGLSIPRPGEQVSGDCWAVSENNGCVRVLVSDGLGHGAGAAEASTETEAVFRKHPDAAPAELLERMHDALRSTRGAAAAVAEIDRGRRLVRFAGVGNIAGTILSGGTTRSVVSHHGTLGQGVRGVRVQEFTYPWPEGALLVLHSDGLVSRWTLDRYAGLGSRHPMLVAGVLYRDFRRGRDDTTVVVLREVA